MFGILEVFRKQRTNNTLFSLRVLERSSSVNIMIHLPDDLGRQMETIPDQNEFIVHALRTAFEKYQEELNAWHTRQIQKGLKEADAGNFASEEEVEGFFSKWVKNAH